MARSRPKMAPELICEKHLTVAPLVFDGKTGEFVNYALVRLNAQKRVLKAIRPIRDLDIYLKKPKNPFSPRPYIAFFFLVISLNMV